MRTEPRFADMTPSELQLEIQRLSTFELDRNAFISRILELCDTELGWFGTSDYTGSIEISDIVEAMWKSSWYE